MGIAGARNQKAARGEPRAAFETDHHEEVSVFGRPGSDLLFQVLRLSTIGAGKFYGRVRDGIGYRLPASTTRPAKNRLKQTGLSSHPVSRPKRMRIEDKSDQAKRAISTGKLNASPRLHTRPINVVVYHGS